jgi:aspartate/tyrosine/aromatic aminotransferase
MRAAVTGVPEFLSKALAFAHGEDCAALADERIAATHSRPQPVCPNNRYAAITGVPEFLSKALAFAYGDDCAALAEGRIAATQTLSGTGACRIAAEFYARFLPEGTLAYVSDPTWPNHIPIFQNSGMEVRSFLGAAIDNTPRR